MAAVVVVVAVAVAVGVAVVVAVGGRKPMKLGDGFPDSVIAGSPSDDGFCPVCGQWTCSEPERCRRVLACELASWAGLVDEEGEEVAA